MIKQRSVENKRVLFTFLIVIYGTTMFMTEAGDAYRHKQKVYDDYIDMSWDRFFDDTYKILTFQISSSSSDIYQHFLSFFSGTILQLPGMFFLLVSLVYGYFYSGAMLRIFKNFNLTSKGVLFWFFVLAFIFNKNVEGITTVRTWTGMWVLFYGVLRYSETQQRKYILIMLLAPLVHFGYFIMAIPAFIVVIVGDRVKLFGLLFIVSMFTNLVDPQTISSRTDNFSLAVQKLSQYHQEEDLSASQKLIQNADKLEGRTWYKKMHHSGYMIWPINFMIIVLLFYKVDSILMDKLERIMLSVGLLMLTGANLFFFVWAVTNRMQIIGTTFILAAFILLMQRNYNLNSFFRVNRSFQTLMGITAIGLSPIIIYGLSFFLHKLSVFFFFFPFIVWVEESLNTSTLYLIKQIF